MAHLSWTKFFWHKPLLLLSSTYWPFSLCKILKNSYNGSSYEDVPIFGTKWSICPKQIFFWKIINIILNYPLASFIVRNLKTILPADPELWGAQFLSPKWAFLQSENFIRKPVSFIQAYLHPKNRSQMLISEILAIKEYWNLNGREPFLALT